MNICSIQIFLHILFQYSSTRGHKASFGVGGMSTFQSLCKIVFVSPPIMMLPSQNWILDTILHSLFMRSCPVVPRQALLRLLQHRVQGTRGRRKQSRGWADWVPRRSWNWWWVPSLILHFGKLWHEKDHWSDLIYFPQKIGNGQGTDIKVVKVRHTINTSISFNTSCQTLILPEKFAPATLRKMKLGEKGPDKPWTWTSLSCVCLQSCH